MGGPNVWKKTRAGEFEDVKKERYALARSRGMSSAKICAEIGLHPATSVVWNNNPVMQDRIDTIRESNPTTLVSKETLLAEALSNIKKAREEGQLKASNDAILVAFKILDSIKDNLAEKGIINVVSNDLLAASLGNQKLLTERASAESTLADDTHAMHSHVTHGHAVDDDEGPPAEE